MHDPGHNFCPHNHAAHLIAKAFLTTDPVGKTMVWTDDNGWHLSDDGETLFPEHREVLWRFYEFIQATGLFIGSTGEERKNAIEEVELAARKISLNGVTPACMVRPFTWGADANDFWGTFE